VLGKPRPSVKKRALPVHARWLSSIGMYQPAALLTDSTPLRWNCAILETAIGKLPPEQRQAILLVGLEGMAYEEAAKVLNVPVGTVRSRLSRGRDQLRLLMGMKEERARHRRAA
jgi:DNA-directed RNA polymerase specialized sigma24 family protein